MKNIKGSINFINSILASSKNDYKTNLLKNLFRAHLNCNKNNQKFLVYTSRELNKPENKNQLDDIINTLNELGYKFTYSKEQYSDGRFYWGIEFKIQLT